MAEKETTEIIGSDGNAYTVPIEYVDWFFDGKTGEPVTDAQWDESMRRMREHDPEFKVA